MSRRPNGNGTIHKRIRQINGKEYVDWVGQASIGHDPGTGKLIRKTVYGKTQRECSQRLKELIAAVDNRTYTDVPKMTISEWMEVWLTDYAAPGLKALSVETYKSRIYTHIVPAIGATRIEDVSVPQLQHLCNELSSRLAPKTVISIMAILQEALQQAVELNYLPYNPAERVKRPRKTQREIKPLTIDEATILTTLLKDGTVYADMVFVALWTGLREGETCGLSWDAVDFDHNRITIRQQLQKGKAAGSEHYITTCKEEKTRTLTVAPSVMERLKERKRAQMRHKRDAGMFWRNDWDLVFTNECGGCVPPQTFLKHVKAYMTQIGRPDAYVHTLRHTYAVMALQEGDSIKTVQDNLGHATAAFTLDVYGHVSDEMRKESADRTERLIERAKA